jgi:hypothetical protein
LEKSYWVENIGTQAQQSKFFSSVELINIMVKVLENKLVDLDVMPGQEQIDLQRRFREQMQNVKGAAGQTGEGGEVELPEGAKVIEGEKGAKIAKQQGFQIPKEMLPDNLSDEQKSQARGFGGVVVDGSGKVISGLAGTVGGVLKGVGDTAGNAVRISILITCTAKLINHAQVYGLASTGTGLVTGLADTAKAPFAGKAQPESTSTAQPQSAPAVQDPVDDDAGVPPEKRKPKKIEMRSGGGAPAADASAAGETVED